MDRNNIDTHIFVQLGNTCLLYSHSAKGQFWTGKTQLYYLFTSPYCKIKQVTSAPLFHPKQTHAPLLLTVCCAWCRQLWGVTCHDPLLHPKHNIVICRKHMLSARLAPSFTTLQNIQTGNDHEKKNCSPHDTVCHLCTETTWNCFLFVAMYEMYEMSECVAWINKNSITLKTCLTAFPLHTARKEQKVKENWSKTSETLDIRYVSSYVNVTQKRCFQLLKQDDWISTLDFFFFMKHWGWGSCWITRQWE